MKISTKGKYALSLLIDLAQNNGDKEYISLKTISNRQEISLKYLERIANMLVKTDNLIVSRGANGGYKLSKKVNEYKIGDILSVTEKSIYACNCDIEENISKKCKRYLMWQGLDNVIRKYLDNVTLEDIL